MSFKLENLGINIRKTDDKMFSQKVINFCINKVYNESTLISSQMLLANKNMITEDLLQNIQFELSKKMLEKRKYLIKKLTTNNFEKELYIFLKKYIDGVKSVDITLGLSDTSKSLLSFGNSKFVLYNIELLTDMIIHNPNIKQLFENFIFENIYYNKDSLLLKFLKKFEKYNVVIFEELCNIIIKWSKQKFNIPVEYPTVLQEIYSLNIYLKKSNKIKNFIKKQFPSNNYSDVFIPIFNIIYDKLDTIIKYPHTGIGIINRFIDELVLQISYLNDNKCKFYENQLINKLNEIFNKIEYLDNINDYLNMYNKNSYYTANVISNLFLKYKNSKCLKNLVETIILLDDVNIPVFVSILLNIEKVNNILIRIKIYLTEFIWKLNLKECDKILLFLNFFNNLMFNEYKIIKSMIKNKMESDIISQIIFPHRVYHFTPGVWDFSFKNDYMIYNSNEICCFKEELNAITPYLSSNQEMIVFMTKGKMLIELSDGTNKIECEFLPIQGFVIQKMLDVKEINKYDMISLINSLGIKNYSKVIETLSDLIELKDDNYNFKSSLPNISFINFAERYFTEIYKSIEERIKYECSLSIEEILSSNICSITKKKEDYSIEKNELFKVLKDKISVINFNDSDIENVINIMIKNDYIIYNKENGMYIYQVY